MIPHESLNRIATEQELREDASNDPRQQVNHAEELQKAVENVL